MRIALSLSLLLLAAGPSSASLKNITSFGAAPLRVVFSSLETPDRPETVFDCAGRIYAHMTFSEQLSGAQAVEAHWIRPDGVRQETTKLHLSFTPTASRTTTIWLEFQPENRSMFDEFSFGGDYGGQQEGFHGPWTLKVFSNGKLIDQQTFSVACYR